MNANAQARAPYGTCPGSTHNPSPYPPRLVDPCCCNWTHRTSPPSLLEWLPLGFTTLTPVTLTKWHVTKVTT